MNIGFISLGCPKNLVDTEIMIAKIQNEYSLVNKLDEAEIIVINTCGFIEEAKSEAIETILEACTYKEKNCKAVVVTGCLAERYGSEIFKEIPEVDAVVGIGYVDEIDKVLKSVQKFEKPVLYGNKTGVEYLENERFLTTPKWFAYVKIAEGCDNNCAYCVIPSIRGKYRSRKIENIVSEVESLVAKGAKEVILVAQDVTRYGLDIYGYRKISELLYRLNDIEGDFWIRILYSYPEEITDDLINSIKKFDKVIKYLDIPVQHASDKILARMGRRSSNESLYKIFNKLRKEIPDIVIRTSLIVGFPGEDDSDFETLIQFVKDIKFDRAGVFKYSKEEGTKAYRMKGQISKKVKTERYIKLMELQREISYAKNKERIGKIYDVFVEGVAEDGIFYYGRSYAESPSIDPKIYFTSQEPLKYGSLVRVKILNVEEYDLVGEVVNEFAE